MARLDPRESFDALKEGVTEAVRGTFPIEGGKHVLELEDVQIDDNVSSADFTAQKAAKLSQRTFGIPVKATMVLRDKATGEVIDRSTQRIANLPKITNRYSFIVNGSEFQVENQFRLRPGVYTKVKQNGELESFFNIKGRPLHVGFNPEARKFHVQLGGAKPPLYPILKAMGVSDDTLQQAWGKEILNANKLDTRGRPIPTGKVIKDFAARVDPKATFRDEQEAAGVIRDKLESSYLHPEVTRRTLGAPIDRINQDALLRSTGRLLGISRGQERPDVRDNQIFKDFYAVEDYMKERIEGTRPVIERRVRNNLDRKARVRDIVGPDTFGRPVNDFFSQVSLANTAQQTNPLRMIGNHMRTTIAGEGGVADANRITEDAKLVDPSHFGVLDPLDTPEGINTGVALQLSLGARKVGNALQIPLINAKSGKTELVSVERAHDSTVALPDAVRRTKRGFVPAEGGMVLASIPGNDVRPVRMRDVQYIVPKSAQMFGLATNMVPFINSDSPNRATMAGRHMSQAVPVEHGEVPLVQAVIGKKPLVDLVGSFASHHAPQAGEVVGVTEDAITLRTGDGKKVDVPIYNHYPLNDKTGFMHSTPTVKVGERVTEGQLIGDTNFTKGGQYAPGRNLSTAYLPWKGLTFEDGVVLSDSAAQKMTSVHMHRPGVSLRNASLDGKQKYQAYFRNRMSKDQAAKLDDTGVVQVGQRVKPGDTLVAAMAERKLTTEEQKLQLLHKSIVSPKKDMAVTWDEDHEGEVVGVMRRRDRVEVHVKTREPMQVGDKLAAAHGNKGIVTAILADPEMPQTKDGKPIDIIMNPLGVAGRMNVGQLLETAAGKVAEKRGRPVQVENFTVQDNLEHVSKLLKEEGLKEKEDLIDPATGRTIPKVFTGNQYVFKLEHQVDKKMASRDRGAYDHNLVPRGGGKHGAQAFGALGTYAMLSHGARANLREANTWKSDKSQGGVRDELWGALQAGEMLPPPRPTFAYNKFLGYLRGLGVNMEGDGNSLNLVPLTDKDTLEMSSGELRDAGRMIRMKDQKPERGGLFDEKITGGMDGKRWSHLTLAKPMPNPVFERAIMSLAGIRAPVYQSIIAGQAGVSDDGNVVTESGKAGVTYGPAAVGKILDRIDVKSDLEREKARLPKLNGQLLNETRRKVKYLQALDRLQMKPTDAYMMRHVPVLPPAMRPIAITEDGRLQTDDLNELYKGLALVNMKAGQFPPGTPQSLITPVEADIYDHLRSLTGVGGHLNNKFSGILQTIAGKGSPKEGYVQNVLLKRKQDLTMRSTIVPNPKLGLDEVELPRKAAKEMYKPFVVRELRRTAGVGPLEAKKMVDENDPLAVRTLDRVVQERPVMLKRDPALHRYSVQSFKPRLTDTKTIGIHPLVCSGFNADFDGDQMSAYVPISNEAVHEAEAMFPSRNLFSAATHRVMYTPDKEMQVGLYMATEVGKKTNQSFKTESELERAHAQGKVGLTDVVKVTGADGKPTRTTLGRLRVSKELPEELRKPVLSDLQYRLTKGEQGKLFQRMAQLDGEGYPERTNRLKDLGNEVSTSEGFTLGLEDMRPHREIRDPLLRAAATKTSRLDLSKPGDVQQYVDAFAEVSGKLDSALKQAARDPRNQSQLARLEVAAGIKGNGYKQLVAAPVLFVDGKGEVVPNAVRRSYAEGLRTMDYWSATSGGRKGIVQKVQSVREPGYLTKMMMNSTMDQMVDTEDCETARGIGLRVEDPDVLGRFTVAPVKLGRGKEIPANTLLTDDLVTKIRNNNPRARVVVRSPIRCDHHTGVCAKCMGLTESGKLPDLGTNVGVLAAQALGERGTQLALRSFHSGGVYEGKESAEQSLAAAGLDRATSLLYLPQKVKDSATLATKEGTVEAIKKDPAGGHSVMIRGTRHYVPAGTALTVKAGQAVRKGDPITTGYINPHQLLPLAGVNRTQGFLAQQLHSIYGKEGIRRRNSELLVRAMSNVAEIEDSGDHPALLRGDLASTPAVARWNREHAQEKGVKYSPVLRGVKLLPLDVQEDWMARLNHTRLKSTLTEAAQQGWTTEFHGTHPVPGLISGASFGKGTPEKPWRY